MESGSCRCCSVAAAGSGSTRNASSVCSIHFTVVTGMRIPDTTSLVLTTNPTQCTSVPPPGLTTYCPVSTLMSYTSVFGLLDPDDEGSTKCFPDNMVSHPRRLETWVPALLYCLVHLHLYLCFEELMTAECSFGKFTEVFLHARQENSALHHFAPHFRIHVPYSGVLVMQGVPGGMCNTSGECSLC